MPFDPKEKVQCTECLKTVSAANLSRHMKIQHPEHVKIKRTNDPKEKVQCTECLKTVLAGSLSKHMKIHDPERVKVKCTEDVGGRECGQEILPESLAYHVASNHQPPLLKCSYCDMTYSAQTALNKHELCHTRRIHCTHEGCDATFSRTSALNQHVKDKHTNVRTVCEDCGQSFARLRTLKKHASRCPGGVKTADTETPNIEKPKRKGGLTEIVSKVARKRSIDEVSDEEEDGEEDGEEDEDVAAALSSNEDFQYYLQFGFDESMEAVIRELNEDAKKLWPDCAVRQVSCKYIFDPVQGIYCLQERPCSGFADQPCPYTSSKTTSNTLWQKSAGILKPLARCVLCNYKHQSSSGRNDRAARLENFDKTGHCVYTWGCKRRPSPGQIVCEHHKALLRDHAQARITRRGEAFVEAFARTPKSKRPVKVWAHEDILRRLCKFDAELPAIWIEAFHRHKQNRGLWYIDTEFAGSLLVHVALIGPDNECRLNVVVDHGKTLEELLHDIDVAGKNGISAMQSAMRRGVVSKFYDPESRIEAERATPEQLAEKLEALDFSSSMLIEWSRNYCDYTNIVNTLQAIDRFDLMPPIKHRLSGLHLIKSYLLPGHWTYSLRTIYPFIFPLSGLRQLHHIADIDATKLRSVIDLAFKICGSFAELES